MNKNIRKQSLMVGATGALALFSAMFQGAVAQELGGEINLSADNSAVSAKSLAAAIETLAPSKGAALVLPVAALAVPEVANTVDLIVTNPETGVAIEGFDPVGYFTEGKPMKGDANFAAEYQGAVFHFASAENRDLFTQDPERFAPAFGAYCTQTLAMGSLTPASPLHWTIHGDRLFLTRSAEANKAFREKREETITAGRRFWADASDAFQHKPNTAAHRNQP